MKMYFKCVLLIWMVSFSKAQAQSVPNGLELMEIIKVNEAYRTAADLSFDINITYADSATPTSITERVIGSYKIHGGKYWGLIDNVEFLQGNQFNMAIYHNDSVIVITDRQEYTSVLQLPLMDSLFREANIADMSVSDVNDTARSLRILFKGHSPFHSYEMKYNNVTYRITQVKYYLTETEMDATRANTVVCVSMNFSNYSEKLVSDDEFKESKFVYRFNDGIKLQPAYAGFRLMINTRKEN